MIKQIKIEDTTIEFQNLVKDAKEGEEVVITQNDTPILKLTPIKNDKLSDLIDYEYLEYASKKANHDLKIEDVRKTLSKIKGSMSEKIIELREERI